MPHYTDAVHLIWQLAAAEAVRNNHREIAPEQVFIALCQAPEFLEEELGREMAKIISRQTLEEEVGPIQAVFQACRLAPRRVRRHLRKLVGMGEHQYKEGEVVHRDQECRACFDRAETLARDQGEPFLYPQHLLQALLLEPRPRIQQTLSDLQVQPRQLLAALEEEGVRQPVAPGDGPEELPRGKKPGRQKGGGRANLLARFCRDLNALARERKLRPLIGRKDELLQIVRTLVMHGKNNPLLIGEAGVGKTAIVEGLAQRLEDGNIQPASLRHKKILELNLAAVVSGAKYRGEFEERLQGIIREIQATPDLILFIDEIHTIMGAGAASGALDAASILKPLLDRGGLTIIGATTWEDYRRSLEKDKAIDRRFEPIRVDEPTPEETLQILQQLQPAFQENYQVMIHPLTGASIIEYARRYLPQRRFPAKALDLMHKVCARAQVPTLSNPSGATGETGGAGISPHCWPQVTPELVAQVIAQETGLPMDKITDEDRRRLQGLADTLKSRVIGQDAGVEQVVEVVKLARTGFKNPARPSGVFLLLGPTGVGKTELAKGLAEALFEAESELIRLDMGEYTEKHSVSRLIGAPPGYVGFDEGGQLTEMLRRRPYSVVLLDEIDKAHPQVLHVLLHLFDEGRLTDGQGRTVDGKNAIFLMTANVGADLFYKPQVGFIRPPGEDWGTLIKELQARVRESFPPEFLNRMDSIICFQPLEADNLQRIAAQKIRKLEKRLAGKQIALQVSSEALSFICQQDYDPQYGARHIERMIQKYIEIPLSDTMLRQEIQAGQIFTVRCGDDGLIYLVEHGTC